MRWRRVLDFLAGFIAGMLFLLVLLWWRGPGAPTARASARAADAVPAAPAIEPAGPLDLIVPVAGADPARIHDTFDAQRGSGRHQATDILAARGTPVLAAADGAIVKLFLSRAGGNTIYQFDPTSTWCYYYAHLDRYAPPIHEGMTVRQGDTIGYVGNTGDAAGGPPHLHFAIFRLGPEKHWWQGTAIDPYPILMRHGADSGR